MSATDNVFYITLMDKSFKINCAATEEPALREAAKLLHADMKKRLKPNAKTDVEQVAVVSALNFAHQLIGLKKENCDDEQGLSERLALLQKRVQQTLEKAN
jgi:cell division protein ZapA